MITPEHRRAAVRRLVAAERPAPGHEPDGTVGWLKRLCRAAVRALPVDGTSISLMSGDGVRGVVAASAPSWGALDQLQFALGEGPCLDAFAARRPVLETGLDGRPDRRWPGYWAAARERDVGAVFAFPLQVGGARLGTLTVYRSAPGLLAAPALADALTFGEVAVETLLDGQQKAPSGEAEPSLEAVLDEQFVVYQAQGMITVDLGVPLPDAMARLQAHAYVTDRPLLEVARDVVAGRLTLERDEP